MTSWFRLSGDANGGRWRAVKILLTPLRPRRSFIALIPRLKPGAYSKNGFDVVAPRGCEFFAYPADMHVERPRARTAFVAPHSLEKGYVRDGSAGLGRQRAQQLVLFPRQVHDLGIDEYQPPLEVDFKTVVPITSRMTNTDRCHNFSPGSVS